MAVRTLKVELPEAMIQNALESLEMEEELSDDHL